MERKVNIEIAKSLFKDNFIGPEELSGIKDTLPLIIPESLPEIPYPEDELLKRAKDYLLILCVSSFADSSKIDILKLRDHFGINPDKQEPCFYNQDWYMKEDFVQKELEPGWVLLRKNVFENTRSIDPNIIDENYPLPSAILCSYAFFVHSLVYNSVLWQYDFIWCSDRDHNGDRIYVGKYFDIDGINKNGFSIHRHLALRPCYASIEVIKLLK